MASNKLARTNDDIQFVMSKLLREIKDPRVQQGMISVTRVETTGDLRYSKIWLSVMGMKDEKEFKKGLKSASGWLRHELGTSDEPALYSGAGVRGRPQYRVRRAYQRGHKQSRYKERRG
ncbi:MAG: ribosome-binding factor A [Oscillospiraceae bacterium]